jgi:hypothetical protein
VWPAAEVAFLAALLRLMLAMVVAPVDVGLHLAPCARRRNRRAATKR